MEKLLNPGQKIGVNMKITPKLDTVHNTRASKKNKIA